VAAGPEAARRAATRAWPDREGGPEGQPAYSVLLPPPRTANYVACVREIVRPGPWGAATFQEVSEAYEHLSDPDRQREWVDLFREREGIRPAPHRPPPPGVHHTCRRGVEVEGGTYLRSTKEIPQETCDANRGVQAARVISFTTKAFRGTFSATSILRWGVCECIPCVRSTAPGRAPPQQVPGRRPGRAPHLRFFAATPTEDKPPTPAPGTAAPSGFLFTAPGNLPSLWWINCRRGEGGEGGALSSSQRPACPLFGNEQSPGVR